MEISGSLTNANCFAYLYIIKNKKKIRIDCRKFRKVF